MKVTTWNVNGLRAREGQVADWLRLEQPDVLCLQEIKASPHQVPARLQAPDDWWTFWHGAGGYSGVALLVKKAFSPTRPRFEHPAFDRECRVVVARFERLAVASLYIPNGGKDFAAKMRFLEALDAWVQQQHAAGVQLVLCGDYNVARTEVDVHEKLRDPRAIGQTPDERALLERLISHGLTDLGRRFAPDDQQLFTWWAPWRNYRERNIGWRLDLVLASEGPAAVAQRCTAMREFGTSDHGPVTAVFEGPLFDARKVEEGPAQVIEAPPAKEPKKKKGQGDLFG